MFAINWSTLGSIGATAVGGITAAGLAAKFVKSVPEGYKGLLVTPSGKVKRYRRSRGGHQRGDVKVYYPGRLVFTLISTMRLVHAVKREVTTGSRAARFGDGTVYLIQLALWYEIRNPYHILIEREQFDEQLLTYLESLCLEHVSRMSEYAAPDIIAAEMRDKYKRQIENEFQIKIRGKFRVTDLAPTDITQATEQLVARTNSLIGLARQHLGLSIGAPVPGWVLAAALGGVVAPLPPISALGEHQPALSTLSINGNGNGHRLPMNAPGE